VKIKYGDVARCGGRRYAKDRYSIVDCGQCSVLQRQRAGRVFDGSADLDQLSTCARPGRVMTLALILVPYPTL